MHFQIAILVFGVHAVEQLTKANFNSTIKKTEGVLVNFYTPWCRYCQDLEEPYREIAKKINEPGKLLVAAVNCDEAPEIAVQHDVVNGFPALLWFSNGEIRKYEGKQPSVESVTHWIESLKDDSTPSQDLLVLNNTESFDAATAYHKVLFVAFVASADCSECTRMAPIWRDAAKRFNQPGQIMFAQVDVNRNPELIQRLDVGKWPTFLWFEDGIHTHYFPEERNTFEELIEYTKQNHPIVVRNGARTGPPIRTTVTLYHRDLSQSFIKLARKHRDVAEFRFVQVDEYRVTLQHVGRDVKENNDPKKTQKFVTMNLGRQAADRVHELSPVTWNTLDKRRQPFLFAFLGMNETNVEHVVAQNIELLVMVADANDNLIVCWEDTSRPDGLSELFGIQKEPALVYYPGTLDAVFGSPVRYAYDGDLDFYKIQAFIQSAVAGKLERQVKSAELPQGLWKDGLVKPVTTNTFDNVVYNAKKDVVLFAHVNWDDGCEAWSKPFADLAKIFQDAVGSDKWLLFAKINVDENDAPTSDFADWDMVPRFYFVKERTSKLIPLRARNMRQLFDAILNHHSFADKVYVTLLGKGVTSQNIPEEPKFRRSSDESSDGDPDDEL